MPAADAVSYVRESLAAIANADRAVPMAAYLKTDMPFYGVQKAGRDPIQRELVRAFPPSDFDEYVETVSALWALPHREEKYVALHYARSYRVYVNIDAVPLYRRLIVEGAWWDLVDEVATQLVGSVLESERTETTSTIRSWIRDDDLWLRRVSIICQLKHKADTDTELLHDACVENLPDTDFFVRKAIGWSLRQYARTDPEWVLGFVAEYRNELSPLSYREATKHL